MTEFISRNYGKEGYEIIIKTDSHDHYRATEEFARRLIDHAKPMRNAEKIRVMSDDELAEWLTEFANEAFAAGAIGFGGALMTEHDRLTWLQQPAEVEHEDRIG